MTSGSDFDQPQDLARGGIIVRERIKTSADLVIVIREGAVTGLVGSEL